jgi:hypothetical protein
MLRLILRISVFAISAASLLAGQSSKPNSTSAANFIGEWKVGLGVAGESFTITLEKGGKATKSHGSPDGTWTVYGDEARITWNDGWHDVLRRAGNRWEKVAYAPGKSFSDQPDNITGATRTEPM